MYNKTELIYWEHFNGYIKHSHYFRELCQHFGEIISFILNLLHIKNVQFLPSLYNVMHALDSTMSSVPLIPPLPFSTYPHTSPALPKSTKMAGQH